MNSRKKWVTLLVLLCFVIASTLLYNFAIKPRKVQVKIAIFDSGINEEHEFFENLNFSSFGKYKYNGIDNFNHGTGVTSLIVDSLTKTQKKALIIYNVKILDEKGIGELTRMKEGLRLAINENVDVINISAGFQTYDAEIEDLIKEADNKGIIIIASAGNNIGFKVDYPARFKEVISISSINKDMDPSPTSSVGKIDFVSVGENVKVANNDYTYGIQSGSSYATAKVTGYLLSEMLKNDEITDYHSAYQYLLNSAKHPKTPTNKEIYGNGIIEN
ncbi:S8 family serine peptidase [Sutcliffiella horikoshii]|uniref:S8 family peptidase n=1 Tax=Sutcliffiella horikoshii TaxID=79883 RepID=UPI00384B47AE